MAFDLKDLSSHIKNQSEDSEPPQQEPETPPPPVPDDSGSKIDQPLPEFKSNAEIPRSFTKLKELYDAVYWERRRRETGLFRPH